MCRLLLVDDEPDAVELFRQSFRREIRGGEYDIRFAASGEEALAMLTVDGADGRILLLCDINMPGMSGLDLLREVRRRWPLLPVIMVTAYGDADNRRRALQNGASAFVTKPVDFEDLKKTLRGRQAGERI
ncbi:MAG TPA: response regulator [Rhodospirillales bacterium]|nr:response regulator [Rhodospirillales bacterium]